jgi:hypothetical protein
MSKRRSVLHLQSWCRPVWVAGLTVLLLALSPTGGRSCGYHDDVSIARGVLNWTYPDALHVIGAISAAVAQKQLTYHGDERVAPGFFGLQYHATVKALGQFADSLRAAPRGSLSSVSLVLIEPMLWTRFEMAADELHTRFHVQGPEPGDLVLVSGQDVIRALASRQMTIAEAYNLGLIRLYGTEKQSAAFLGTFKEVRGEDRSGRHGQLHTRDLELRQAVMQ